MNERPNQLFYELEKVKYKDLLIDSLLMPISVPSSYAPQKRLQFLHVAMRSPVGERIDGKQTPDLLRMEKLSTLALKATFMKLKDNISCIILKSRLRVLCFDFWLSVSSGKPQIPSYPTVPQH